MTETNKKENILDEMERAVKAMGAASLLFENGFLNDAISRLYYSILHDTRALLLVKGLEPKSHEGALRLFSLHFVKEGSFQPADSHILSRLMKYREEADYNPSYMFTKEDFIEFKRDAEKLSNKMKVYLKDKCYI
jgi:uncharacterized protein (UPF0332 family)